MINKATKRYFLKKIVIDELGIRLFAFHGRINGVLKEIEPGELNKDVTAPTNNFWVYEDPKVELRVGDYIGYWVYVQHEYLGYRKDNLTWQVKGWSYNLYSSSNFTSLQIFTSELVTKTSLECKNSKTKYNSKTSTCKGALLFHDSFDVFDDKKWQMEKYKPNEPVKDRFPIIA